MCLDDLTIVVFHEIGMVAMQYANPPCVEWCGMAAGLEPIATGFDTHHFHIRVIHERVKEADCIGATTNASNQDIR